ncbi:hypothetical protein GCM10010983_25830 [Caulobacter rhizosphaerae]|nr:hypothetical protein GCM10010983_25830 [Caulobacter rhizosphaerae]
MDPKAKNRAKGAGFVAGEARDRPAGMAENVSAIRKLLSFVAKAEAIGASEAGAVLARSHAPAVGGARGPWEASQEEPVSRAGSGRYFEGRGSR